MIRSVLRAWLVSLALAMPLSAAADDTRAALGREMQSLASYSIVLAQKYTDGSKIWQLCDEIIGLINEFQAGNLSDADLRNQMQTEVTAIEDGIRTLEIDFAKLPEAPTVGQPETLQTAQAIAVFRRLVQDMPTPIRRRLQLIEQLGAAALAKDASRYEELQREHDRFIAEQIDGETAVLRAQLEFVEPENYMVPLLHCAIHINDAYSALFRSWADANESGPRAATEVMAYHLKKAERSLQYGERRRKKDETVWNLNDSMLRSFQPGARETEEIFRNLRESYEVEHQLLDASRALGSALDKPETENLSAEQAPSLDEFWTNIAILMDRRMALDIERQEILIRAGASLQ